MCIAQVHAQLERVSESLSKTQSTAGARPASHLLRGGSDAFEVGSGRQAIARGRFGGPEQTPATPARTASGFRSAKALLKPWEWKKHRLGDESAKTTPRSSPGRNLARPIGPMHRKVHRLERPEVTVVSLHCPWMVSLVTRTLRPTKQRPAPSVGLLLFCDFRERAASA
jgi:hypothetical protein